MELLIVVKLILIAVFILMGAYFNAVETAILSISGLGLTGMKEKHPKISKCLTAWETNPDNLIVTILVGNNLMSIGAGVLSVSLALDFAGRWFIYFIPFIVVVLVLMFSDIAPKIYSRLNAEAVCISGIPLLIFFSKLFFPVTNILVRFAKSFMRLIRIHERSESPFLSKEELQILLNSDTEPITDSSADSSLGLSRQEKKMFSNILLFGERRVQEVMVPRPEIFAIDYNTGLDEIINRVLTSKYSRIPVYKGSLDNIIGVIYAKDLILTWQNRKLFVLDDIIRPAYFVPENILVDNLIREFKSGKHHLAVVVDEYGVAQGLITVEDIVEEIVGEIYDEYDIREKPITDFPCAASTNWVVKATRSIHKVNEELKLGVQPTRAFTTVGGWVLTLFKKIPAPGEKIVWKEFTIEIVDADRKKIKIVKITK
ncbi:MAG: hemolysin family protein [Elusimicrobia bacterium]|nr:hemolysin family protein [Elusimicrobiota bacterium]